VGFIGYGSGREGTAETVRIYLECQEEAVSQVPAHAGCGSVSCRYAVDVVFPGGEAPCRLRGIDDILVLKKFYKMVFSLEERAREHGHEFRAVFASPQRLLEHLGYTRNARAFLPGDEPWPRTGASVDVAEPECVGEDRRRA
jgi:hypothetical protein